MRRQRNQNKRRARRWDKQWNSRLHKRAALPDQAQLLTSKEAPITRARDSKALTGFSSWNGECRDEGRSAAAPATARRCYNLIVCVCILIEIGLGAHAAAVGDVTAARWLNSVCVCAPKKVKLGGCARAKLSLSLPPRRRRRRERPFCKSRSVAGYVSTSLCCCFSSRC